MDRALNQAEVLEGVARTVAGGLGCELWSVRLHGGRGNQVLKVVIDAPGGVDVERIARVARALETPLERAGFDLHQLEIEVSSPGAERPLRGPDEYRSHVGQRVHLRYRSGDSERVVEGRLLSVADDRLVVESQPGLSHEVAPGELLEARLAVDFGSGDAGRRRHR